MKKEDAVWEQLDWYNAKLWCSKFSCLKLQNQKGSARYSSTVFPPQGYKICLQVTMRQPELKRQSCALVGTLQVGELPGSWR